MLPPIPTGSPRAPIPITHLLQVLNARLGQGQVTAQQVHLLGIHLQQALTALRCSELRLQLGQALPQEALLEALSCAAQGWQMSMRASGAQRHVCWTG